MRGFTITHFCCIVVLLFTLWGIGTSTAPYSFNWGVFENVWYNATKGIDALNKGQGEVAKRLEAQSRANLKTKDSRPGICNQETIDESTSKIPLSTITQLKSDFSKNDTIALLGNPYCLTFDNKETWRIEDDRYLIISGYEPLVARFY